MAGVHHAGVWPAIAITVNTEARVSADEKPREEHHGNDKNHARDDAHPHQRGMRRMRAAVLRGLLSRCGHRSTVRRTRTGVVGTLDLTLRVPSQRQGLTP